jgi:hypothetical protein
LQNPLGFLILGVENQVKMVDQLLGSSGGYFDLVEVPPWIMLPEQELFRGLQFKAAVGNLNGVPLGILEAWDKYLGRTVCVGVVAEAECEFPLFDVKGHLHRSARNSSSPGPDHSFESPAAGVKVLGVSLLIPAVDGQVLPIPAIPKLIGGS